MLCNQQLNCKLTDGVVFDVPLDNKLFWDCIVWVQGK